MSKILIVDDTPKNIQMAMNMLKNEGYQMFYAKDAKMAYKLINIHRFDLILMDIMMPEINGLEACETLKTNPATADIPIIFLTVKDDEKDIIKGFDCGGVDYVTKPFNPSILIKRVQTHIALSDANKSLKLLNENLYQQVAEQVDKVRIQDQMLFQQSKMAAMGEMIGNIAHQWRQPLGAISSTVLTLKTKLDADTSMCDDADALQTFVTDFKVKLNDIGEYVTTLSATIDDFRNFFKPTKDKNRFKITSLLQKSIKLLSANLEENDITIIKDVTEVDMVGLENELAQVIINILNNAKEAILQSKNPKFILILAKENGGTLHLQIKDSGGGVDQSIVDKIFEPYFTTKHQASGTGIGLFMSKEIIEKHMLGKIKVENQHFTIDNQSLYGACFTIEIPTT